MVEVYLPYEFLDALLNLAEAKNWYDQPFFIAIASGGTAVLAAAVTAFSTLVLQKSRERHEERSLSIKMQDEKKKLVHEKKISALRDLAILKESMLPSIWGRPSADAYEFYDDFLRFNAKSYLCDIDRFKKKWMYILSDSVLKEINNSILILNEFDHEAIEVNIMDYSFSTKELDRVEDVYNKLGMALDGFKHEMGVVEKCG